VLDQNTAEKWYESNGTTLVRTFAFTYDDAGQQTAAEDPDSEYAFTYDNLGRTLTDSNSGTSGVPVVVLGFAYNANSSRTSLAAEIASADDFLNTYTFDNLGRLTRIEQTGQSGGNVVANKAVGYAYDAGSRVTAITRQAKPSSTWNEVATSTFTYDAIGRLTALDHTHSSTTIAAYDWTYDAASRVTQLSSPDGTSDYTYDNTSQLTGADHSAQTDESYSYDENGNRTMFGYDTGDNNQLLSDGTYEYEYDGEGNRILRTHISSGAVTEYTWDWRNRLIKIVERGSAAGPITKQTEFTYDVFDRRLKKSHDADGAGSGTAIVARYVYDGTAAILQFDGSNNLKHRYVNGSEIEPILADEAVTSLTSSGTLLWPLMDNLGTVRDLVNDSGSVQNHIEYDSFGNVTAESTASVDFLFGFAAGIRDEETGLQYHRARYYDPVVGRFTSEDPISFSGDLSNVNRYANNEPTVFIDPSGLDWKHPQGTMDINGKILNDERPEWPWELMGETMTLICEIAMARLMSGNVPQPKIPGNGLGPFNVPLPQPKIPVPTKPPSPVWQPQPPPNYPTPDWPTLPSSPIRTPPWPPPGSSPDGPIPPLPPGGGFPKFPPQVN
jgi:RHS repeat-associated protein